MQIGQGGLMYLYDSLPKLIVIHSTHEAAQELSGCCLLHWEYQHPISYHLALSQGCVDIAAWT